MITIIIDLSQASPVQLEQYFQHTDIQRAIQTLSAVDKGVSIQVKVLQARTSPPSQESGRRGYLRLRRNKTTIAGPTAHQSTMERDIEQQADAPLDELRNHPQQPVTIKYRHRRQVPLK